MYGGDSRSLNSIFNKKGTSQYILSAITRSLFYTELTHSEYIAEKSKKGVAQIPQVASLLGAGRNLVEEVEK